MMKIKPFYLGLFLVILLGIAWLNSFLLNLDKPLGFENSDPVIATFILKHYMHVFFSGQWNELFTVPMFYGLKYSLFLCDHHFIFAIMAVPIYVVTHNIIFTTNLLSALGIITSLVSMYIFSFYITKKVLPSVLASVIYTLNPNIGAHFPDHLILIWLTWIPLIVLFLEKSLEKPTNKNLLLFFFFLTCQLLSSLYYSAFLTVILPLYAVVRFWQKKQNPRRLINAGAIVGGLVFIIVALGSVYFYTKAINYAQQFAYKDSAQMSFRPQRDIGRAQSFSPEMKDLVIDSLHKNIAHTYITNHVFGGVSQVLRPINYAEITIFFGLLPLFLLVLGPFFLLGDTRWRLFFCLFLISVIVSLGPVIQITNHSSVPGIFALLYSLNPLFHFLRFPARMAVFSFFFLGLIASLFLTKLEAKISYKKGIFLGLFLIIAVTFEYLNFPVKYLQVTPEQKNFYDVLNKQDQIKVIVDLPMGEQVHIYIDMVDAYNVDSNYIAWATILHSKNLLNGYNGYFPGQYMHLNKTFFGINFPSPAKLIFLKKLGVDGIVLHRKEYGYEAEYYMEKKALEDLGVREVIATDNLALFDLTSFK